MRPSLNLKSKEDLIANLNKYSLTAELTEIDKTTNNRFSKLSNQTLKLVNVAEMDQILANLEDDDDDEMNLFDFETKSVRYLVNASKEVVIGKEGRPGRTTPSHFQLTKMSFSEAKCLAAGNLKVHSETRKICFINNKSGDFKPSPEKILWMIAFLVNNYYDRLADQIVIELQSSLFEQFLIRKTDLHAIVDSCNKPHIDFSSLKDHAVMDYNTGQALWDSRSMNHNATRQMGQISRLLFSQNQNLEVQMPRQDQIPQDIRISGSEVAGSALFTDGHIQVDQDSDVTDTNLFQFGRAGMNLSRSRFTRVNILAATENSTFSSLANARGFFTTSSIAPAPLSTPSVQEATASRDSAKRARSEQTDYLENESDSDDSSQQEEKRPRV